MPALKLTNFGGMIPAVDATLLPENQAAVAENAWVYSGAIEGFREAVAVHTLENPLARRAFRIPIEFYDKNHITDSYWLEFENTDVDVVSSPVVDDQHERYYWAFSQTGGGGIPQYNTKARIATGSSPFTLGIPRPTVAPYVTRASGQYWMTALGGTVSITGGGNTHLYLSKSYAQDANSFANGGVPATNPSQYGATQAISSTKGNVDKSAPGPDLTIPKNRYTITGSRAELRYGTTSAGLRITISDTGEVTVGVPPQPAANTTTNPYQGLGVQESRAYVYTWVSAFGEEGPPSPPTTYLGWSADPWIIRVTAPTTDQMTDRNLSKVRIYRTVTGVGGATTYFFVDELDIGQTVYNDSKTSDTVTANNILSSTYYDGPPSDLEGLVAMPNGILAGWRQNEIWFCEPYLPHAWPSPYTIATEVPIVGLGVVGQTLIVCTTGSPYAVSGINPATMAMSRIAPSEPCISRASIVSTPQGVMYASPNGLAMAVPGAVSVVTRNLITKDLWLDSDEYLSTPSLRAALLNGSYYAWGSVMPGCFQTNTFQSDAFVQEDFTGAYQGALIDVNNPRVSWIKLTSDSPVYNCFTDPWSGEVMLMRDGQIQWLDLAKTRDAQSFLWRSKIFETPNMRNFEAMRIRFDSPDMATGPMASGRWSDPLYWDDDAYWYDELLNGFGVARVYADNRLVFTRSLRVTNEFFRLPSGFKAQYWQVEVEARLRLVSIEMSTTAKELANA